MLRIGRLQVGLLALASIVIAAFVLAWLRVTAVQAATSDFSGFYVGGTLVRTGRLGSLYDLATQAAIHPSLVRGGMPGYLPFVNPAPAALLMAPLSALPFFAAYRLNQVVELTMLVAAVVLAVHAAPWPETARRQRVPLVAATVALAGIGTLVLGLMGQWDGIGALGLSGAYALWRRDRRAAGGLVLALSAGFAKPHLALGLAALLLGWRDRRVLAGAAVGVALVVVTTLGLVGVSGIGSLLSATAADGARWSPASMLGFSGLVGSWLGNGALTTALTALLGSAACAACIAIGTRLRRGAPLELCIAAATGLSLLAAPHMLSHDLVLLAPVLVMVTARATLVDGAIAWPGPKGRAVAAGWLLVNLAAAVDLGSQAPAPPGRVVPLALLATSTALALAVYRGVPPAGPVPVLRLSAEAGFPASA